MLASRLMLSVALLGSSLPLWASDKEMEFALTQDCSGQRCQAAALGVGEITLSTPDRLALFHARHPEIKTVFLHSPGGNLGGGVKMGLYLRKNNLNTVLSGKMRCMSACAYAFLGGNSRTVQRGGMLGVHRFSSEKGYDDEQKIQVIVNGLTEYVQGMGVSPRLISAASLAGSNEMIVLDWDDARAVRADNSTSAQADWTLRTVGEDLVVATSGLDAGSDRTSTILVGEAGPAILVAHGVDYPELRPGNPKYTMSLMICVEDDCLRHDKPIESKWNESSNSLTSMYLFDRDEFFEFLDRHATDSRSSINFMVYNSDEATLVGGSAASFSAMMNRTGPQGNYIRVNP